MTSTIRTDRFATKWAVLNGRGNLMRTVTGIKRTHDLHIFFPTDRTGRLRYDQVAGMALESSLLRRNILFG